MRTTIGRMKAILLLALLPLAAVASDPWTVVGRQGLVQVVVVPTARVTDRAAYDAQITRLCPPEQTCFVNFYANKAGVPLALPLPDEVMNQPTATFRRSMKNGAERFQWACRVQPGEQGCF